MDQVDIMTQAEPTAVIFPLEANDTEAGLKATTPTITTSPRKAIPQENTGCDDANPPHKSLFSIVSHTLLQAQVAVSGLTAVGYGVVSLGTVCLNHQVLDTWMFPSSTLILIAQVACTLGVCAGSRWVYLGELAEGSPAASELVANTAPKMAALFVADIALGHAATRSLGLDAFATFRRFCIPFALHLESRRPACLVCSAAWSMVLGPLLGLLCGRGKAKSLAESAASTATDAAAAYVESVSQVSSIILGSTSTPAHRKRGPEPSFQLDGPWDAATWSGCFLALGSALVAAGRVVLLRRALTKYPDDAAINSRDNFDAVNCLDNRTTPMYRNSPHAALVKRIPQQQDISRSLEDGEAGADGEFVSSRWPSLRKINFLEKQQQPKSAFRRWLFGRVYPRCCLDSVTSTREDLAWALLVRSAAISLPLVLAFGVAFDLPGIVGSICHSYLWSSSDFITAFAALITMGPVHEAALYACVLHNSALTTLVAGGFKSTALATYRTVVASAFGAEQRDLDLWDALALAISSVASLVYTYVWWTNTNTSPPAADDQDDTADDRVALLSEHRENSTEDAVPLT